MTMTQHNKHWKIFPDIPEEFNTSISDIPEILKRILYNRGHKDPEDIRQFMEAVAPPGCKPQNLLNIQPAIDRILYALDKQERIIVYGDYDADGVTGTALLILALRWLGAQVEGYIPNRFEEGYGINFNALDELHQTGAQLIISVDCGIRSPEEVTYAKRLGMDMIITDHHHPGQVLPQAHAVINPRQPGDTYPDKNLAGVGLAYKLTQALLASDYVHTQPNKPLPPVEHFLDLVALGTVADLVPLLGENRSLVRSGLEYLRSPQRQGVFSLIHAAGIQPESVTSDTIGYILGPRLNAAGRLETALDALNLLTTSDVSEASWLAQKLNSQNQERQKITREIQEHAEKMIAEKDPEALILIAIHPDYNLGVVGLAASRLSEVFYRPAIVAQLGDEFTRGSCRSIPEFHITKALDECGDLLIHHGGHQAAAGFTIKNEHLPEFSRRLKEIAERELGALDLRATLRADIELSLKDLKPEILHYLNWLEPTGQGNPKVVFISRDVRVRYKKTVGKDSAHLKLKVTDGYITFDAIAFRKGELIDTLPDTVDLMYHYELNEYNGRKNLQLNVIDIKPAGLPD